MIANSKSGLNNTKTIAFFLALSPILDPYVLTEIAGIDFRIMYFVSLALMMLLIASKSKSKMNVELPILAFYLAILTMLSFLYGEADRSFFLGLKNILIAFVLSLIVSKLWRNFNYFYFVKWSYYIAFFAIIFLLIQFLLLNLGINNVLNGKIPFLNLSKYDDWSPLVDVTGAIRVHSIFQEPSYLSIYILPLLGDSLEKRKYKVSLFFLLGIFISTSSVGIVGTILIIVYHLIRREKHAFGNKMKLFTSILVISLIVLTLYWMNDSFKNVVDFSMNKIDNIQTDLNQDRMGSTKLRLLGHIDLFYNSPLYFQIFGIGANQYSGYFHLSDSYSSTIVTLLLDYGVFGLLGFLVWFLIILKKYSESRVFLLIFIMICFIDQFWFNWYFFYILTWVFIDRKNSEGKSVWH